MLREKGLTGSQIGILYGIFLGAGLLFTLPTGISNDRFKSRYLISLGLILNSIFFWGMAYFSSFSVLCLLYFLYSIGKQFFGVSLNALIYKIIHPEQSALKLGQFIGGKTLLAALGAFLGGILLGIFDFKIVFLSAGFFSLLLAVAALFLPNQETYKFSVLTYRKDIWKKEVLFFALVMFLFALHYGAEQTSYGLFLQENLHLDKKGIGIYTGSTIAFLGIIAIYFGYLTQHGKLNAIKTLLIGFSLSGIGHILMTIPDFYTSIFFRSIHEIGDGATIFFMHYGIYKLFPIERIGGNSSLITLISAMGGFIGALITGPLGANLGYQYPLILSGVAILASLVLVLLNKKQLLN
ncbi:MAG: MFS transporter [Candidatus Gracilibacteria bacterium]|nr:MFS transporter [Candidatus Gracilibacteria bacterium]